VAVGIEMSRGRAVISSELAISADGQRVESLVHAASLLEFSVRKFVSFSVRSLAELQRELEQLHSISSSSSNSSSSSYSNSGSRSPGLSRSSSEDCARVLLWRSSREFRASLSVLKGDIETKANFLLEEEEEEQEDDSGAAAMNRGSSSRSSSSSIRGMLVDELIEEASRVSDLRNTWHLCEIFQLTPSAAHFAAAAALSSTEAPFASSLSSISSTSNSSTLTMELAKWLKNEAFDVDAFKAKQHDFSLVEQPELIVEEEEIEGEEGARGARGVGGGGGEGGCSY